MKTRMTKDSWVMTTPVAHRGLVDENTFENTYPAYEKAIEKGYPIEMDVQMTKDGVAVCLHDNNVKRLTGVDAHINDLTFEESNKLCICGSNEHMPLFKDFLKFVDGRVPLMIEIKMQKRDRYNIAKVVVDALKDYKGEFVVQSFDPRIMGRVRKYNPDIIRGQLGGAEKGDKISFPQYIIVRYLIANFISKPDYVNYKIEAMPKKIKLPHVFWTVKNEEQKKEAENYGCNYVFENVRPEIKK